MKPCRMIMVIAAISLSSCNQSTDYSGAKLFPSSSHFDFPLDSGGVWNYDASMSFFNFRPIVEGATFRDTAIRWTSRVQSLGRDTLRDSIEVWRFHTSESEPGVSSADNFYTARNDTLFLYAYNGAAEVLPKQPLPYRFAYSGRLYNSLEGLLNAIRARLDVPNVSAVNDIIFEANPPKVLVFPLRPGLEWTYREKFNPFHIGKRVLDENFMLTPVGFQSMFRVEWRWDIDNRDVWDSTMVGYDYINSRGLIRRAFLLKNFIAFDPNDPTPTGYFDVKIEYLLTSTNL